LSAGTNVCWSCGKDISANSYDSATNGFNFDSLRRLATSLKIVGILSMILNAGAKAFENTNVTDKPLLSLLFVLALVTPLVTNIIWIILWKSMKKSTGSIVTLALILFGLLFSGLILGYLFLFATTSQVDTIIKNKGKVKITFWGVEPQK
jgi:hypothetical protein